MTAAPRRIVDGQAMLTARMVDAGAVRGFLWRPWSRGLRYAKAIGSGSAMTVRMMTGSASMVMVCIAVSLSTMPRRIDRSRRGSAGPCRRRPYSGARRWLVV